MKKLILIAVFASISVFAFSNKVTIVSSGFAFSPANVSINFGDTIVFVLAGIHDAVEVSEATWLANGNSPITGFSVPFGGGQVTGLTTGVHYYVCEPHAAGGMKGKITVNAESGINDIYTGTSFSAYPNPTSGVFSLKFESQGNVPAGRIASVDIMDLLGNRVLNVPAYDPAMPGEIDLSAMPEGIYFVRVTNEDNKVYTARLLKSN
jgi:plastocyanin